MVRSHSPLAAVPGQELTYTATPVPDATRVGIDRDEDGHFDRDELDAGTDPTNPASYPGAPVLVVRGEHDPIANQSFCETIARLCPRGKLSIIPGVAHTLCYTAPVQLAQVTREFIQQS